ncbi:hypothetical protein HPTD01_1693 [Halomonas sp. TD01]|nr:hypothetical protein GME_07839 [Halomonas sp. TD01]CAH1043215.1 hypothetical protein HPTD01_1693 [Halomonas sp. TD01]
MGAGGGAECVWDECGDDELGDDELDDNELGGTGSDMVRIFSFKKSPILAALG